MEESTKEVKECPQRFAMEDPACIGKRCIWSMQVQMRSQLGVTNKQMCAVVMQALNSGNKGAPPQIPPGMLGGLGPN